MIRLTNGGASLGGEAICRWVDRHCPRTRQARRSDTSKTRRTCSTTCRRRDGLRSFPRMLPSESRYLEPDRRRVSSVEHFLPQALSNALPDSLGVRHTPSASGSRSAPLPPASDTPPPAVALWPTPPLLPEV